jgi:thioredoxin reductase (NADPH)
MYDIIIIGSGPAGLSAAVYASRARLRAVVVEKDYMGSGQIAASEQVDNYLGLPGIGGYELGEKFREHAEAMGASFYDGELVSLAKEGEVFHATFADGSTLEGRSVIYAAGTSYRHLEIPGGELLGVSYCATCDGAFYQDKTVAVIGGGDTALGDALYLSNLAKKVYLVHRREQFRGNPMLQERIRQKENIQLVTCAVPTEIVGEKRAEKLVLSQKGTTVSFDVDGVFVAIGSVPNTSPVEQLCTLDASGYILAGESGVTEVPGFFAAGDVRTKSLRQVVTAVADGAVCVQSVEQYFNEIMVIQ